MIHISISQPFGVQYYGLFYIAAVLTGVGIAGIAAIKSKFGTREFAVIVSSGILTLLIVSKLVMFDGAQWNYLFTHYNLPEENGKSTIGAVLGLIIGLWSAGRWLGKNESVLNLFALSLPLGLAVQGLACLSAGCCHGALTNLPWGVTYGPGTRPFIEQQQLGLIPSDAITSLAVHPSQFYTILACLFIAFIVWRTRTLWKSPAGNFMFSIILFLIYRVAEGLSSYSLPARVWMGMNSTGWKAWMLILLSSVLLYQEWKVRHNHTSDKTSRIHGSYYDLRIISLALITLTMSIRLAGWFNSGERALILLILFPLCGLVILEKVVRTIRHIKYIKTSMIVLLAFIFMSQKADDPPDTPTSYTSFNLTSVFGKFELNHEFNPHTILGTGYDCEGNPYTYVNHVYSQVPFHHTYGAGGIGISRKKFYSPWKSTTTSLDIFGGAEVETPFDYPDSVYVPSAFHNTLWSINPMLQYDTKGIGLGLGGSIGMVGYDQSYDLSYPKVYEPKYALREFVLQTRLRLFNERKFFLEGVIGYDAGAVGSYNWQCLAGSRFNSDHYLLLTGLAWSNYNSGSFVVHGELPLFSNLFIAPEFIIYSKNNSHQGGGYRAVLGLQYRLYDKKKNK